MRLPVESVLPELSEALQRGHAVLASPPGSGKTTRVPLALLRQPWLSGRKILMLEPRRPAVRMAATYMARQLGEKPGDTVGYRMRMERRIGAGTRIEVLTEGLFIRMLQEDPELTGVGLVIFDEFHEQSLDSELGLTLCLDVCDSLREDLRLLVMSATLDEAAVANLVGGTAIVSDGGLHPVAVHHLSRSAGKEVITATYRLLLRALEEQEGDVLVFLPGKAEIDRLGTRLKQAAVPAELFQLHGEMDSESQARVLAPPEKHRRRVILATDVAETSLTIEGITTVVDSGLTRKPVFDPNSGLSRLTTQPIPQASASQRTGRAGRLGPGHCYRAWTEAEHRSRPSQRPAEIRQSDLAPLVLQLALWGVTDPDSLRWLHPPPAPAWHQGVALLQKLEALDREGRITKHGRKMAVTGLHPRLGHMLIRGGRDNRTAADLAALLSDRDPWRRDAGRTAPADIGLRLDALAAVRAGDTPDGRFDRHRLRRLLRLSDQLLERTRHLEASINSLSAAALLSLAYPERIAKRRDGTTSRYLLASGKGAELPPGDGLGNAGLLAVATLDAGSREGRIWMALELPPEDLESAHGRRMTSCTELYWDESAETVRTRSIRRLDALALSSRETTTPPGPEASRLLLEAIRTRGIEVLALPKTARQLLARVQLAASFEPASGWPDLGEDTLMNNLEAWLLPWLEGKRTLKEVRGLDWPSIFRSLLTWEQQQELDRLLPTHWTPGDGSRIAIDYSHQPPVLAAPAQQFYGTCRTPSVMRGRLPLQLKLLSPAGRPLQVTTDLAHFWKNGWEQVRKEMRGRYPKHYWPEEPGKARPVKLKRNL